MHPKVLAIGPFWGWGRGLIYYKQAIVLAIRELEEYIELQRAAAIREWL